MNLTQDDLRSILDYDPDTGIFRWRVNRSRMRAGQVAGCKSTTGYWRIKLQERPVFAHRLAWLYVHGCLPEAIDHINGNGADNRICNLRPCTLSQNQYNGRHHKTASGHKGVRPTDSGKWCVRIGAKGKQIYVGIFADLNDAISAYNHAASKLTGEFAVHRRPKHSASATTGIGASHD